jgi:hypothetical protein
MLYDLMTRLGFRTVDGFVSWNYAFSRALSAVAVACSLAAAVLAAPSVNAQQVAESPYPIEGVGLGDVLDDKAFFFQSELLAELNAGSQAAKPVAPPTPLRNFASRLPAVF